LVASVHRRYFDETGKLVDTHGAYLDAVRKRGELRTAELVVGMVRRSRSVFGEFE
jgi:hypothetical protein